jgi:serine/threonine-protein kinase HipA
MALGLFNNGYQTEAYKSGNKYTRPDFIEFGLKIGIGEKRILKILNLFTQKIPAAETLLAKSFLPEYLKDVYLNSLTERVKRVKE